jgi:hypothetical protein
MSTQDHNARDLRHVGARNAYLPFCNSGIACTRKRYTEQSINLDAIGVEAPTIE